MDCACPLCHSDSLDVLFDLGGHDCLRCRDCSMQFLHPQPADDVLEAVYGREYHDVWARDASDEAVDDMKRRTFARLLRLVARHRRGGRLLDVGCALGAMLRAAAAAGYEPVGVELSAAAAGRARRQGEDVFCGRLSEAGFDDESFDVVTMTDLLEHVRDPLATLAEARRVLRPGGVLLITTPDVGGLAPRLLGRHWPHYKLEHLFYFNRGTIRRCLDGFDVLRTAAVTKSLTPAYFGNVLRRYSGSRLLRALGAASAALGRVVNPRLPLRTGELLALARRPVPDREAPDAL